MSERRPLAKSADVAPGQIREADGDTEVIVWRTASGVACASEARCPHQWSHLASQGAVDGEELVCLTHQWRFGTDGAGCIERMSGEREPTSGLQVFACEERDGSIWLT